MSGAGAAPERMLSEPRRAHIVGIGGAGMSAIAAVLVAMGHRVSGSDLKESPALERLRALGVRAFVGHRAEQVGEASFVAVSTAIPADNAEVLEAERLGLPVLSRADLLAAITAERRAVAVSGTHGKTTTSSMLALILLEAGLAPSFLIGGDLNETGTNATWNDGEWVVVEADESDGTFLRLAPEIAVVTSVDADHLDYYGSFEALGEAFRTFLGRAATAVVCADDPVAMALAPKGAVSYGFSKDASLRITGFSGARSAISFTLEREGAELGRFNLPVPGEHNARNAAGAVAAAEMIGAPLDAAVRALARFGGVARRFQFRGEARGVTFVDDYAHLPAEIAATLHGARHGGWRRLVAVFQPHRYSRVAALADRFADAFVDADVVVITGIYGAGEAPRPGVSAKLILDAVLRAHPGTSAAYLPQRDDLVAYLTSALRPGDCCLTMSAGDLTTLPDALIARVAHPAS